MTNEEFDSLMTALNVYAERGELEYCAGSRWVQWSSGGIEGKFRVKPKPREVFVLRSDIEPRESTRARLECMDGRYAGNNLSPRMWVRFREVIE